MAFHGTPLEDLPEEHAEDAITGALMTWAAFDELKAQRIYLKNIDDKFTGIIKALNKKKK